MALATLKFHNQGVFPNPEAITITRPKSNVTIAVAVAHRRPMSTREAAKSNGMYLSSDMRWKFDESYTAGDRVRPGYSVVDSDGIVWRVLEASGIHKLTNFELLTCRNLALIYNINDTVDIRRAVKIRTDLAGRAIRTYEWFARNLPARYQPADRPYSMDDVGAARLTAGGIVYLLEDPGLLASDQICLKDGRALEVMAVNDPETLDALPSVTCDDNGARWDTTVLAGSAGDL